MRPLLLIAFCCLILPFSVLGQSATIPVNKDYTDMIDRYEILNGKFLNANYTSVKPYERKALAQSLDSLKIDSTRLSKADKFNLNHLKYGNWEWHDSSLESNSKKPILKHFYKKKSDFYQVQTKDFDLHINPVVYFMYGKENIKTDNLFLNTRGAELRGTIDGKVGFYAFAADNQARFPSYTDAFISNFDAVPQEGFYKRFKVGGVDFLTARGYFNFNATRHINVEFGHGKHFIGNGYRSLILSDFSSNYTYLKLNTRIWKFNYMNLFTEMNAGTRSANNLFPKKYMAFHHLSLNITPNINIGLFEAVAFGRKDSLKNGTFDINYLNPIIFYRSIEQQLGSSDNALLGMDYKVNFLKHFSWYGQIVLDEFLLSEIKARNGWWANKQAMQTGLKYINAAGIKNLDLQGEFNLIRPYTYAHANGYTNYTHYNQPLAHPLGANLFEYVGIIRYQPIPRLNLVAKAFYIKTGLDTLTSNWGGNIMLDYRDIERQHGNFIGQGISTTVKFLSMTVSYQIMHNLYADLTHTIRKSDSALDTYDSNTNFTALSIRWNIPQRLQEF